MAASDLSRLVTPFPSSSSSSVTPSMNVMSESDRKTMDLLDFVDSMIERDPILCPTGRHAQHTVREAALRALHCLLIRYAVYWKRLYPASALFQFEGVMCLGRGDTLPTTSTSNNSETSSRPQNSMCPTTEMTSVLREDTPSAFEFSHLIGDLGLERNSKTTDEDGEEETMESRVIDFILRKKNTVFIIFDLFLPQNVNGVTLRELLSCFGNDAYLYATPRKETTQLRVRVCMTERSILEASRNASEKHFVPSASSTALIPASMASTSTSSPKETRFVQFIQKVSIDPYLETLKYPLRESDAKFVRAAWHAICVISCEGNMKNATMCMAQSQGGRKTWIMLENVDGFCVNHMQAIWNARMHDEVNDTDKCLVTPKQIQISVHPHESDVIEVDGFRLQFLVAQNTSKRTRSPSSSEASNETERGEDPTELPEKRARNK